MSNKDVLKNRVCEAINVIVDKYGRPCGVRAISHYLRIEEHIITDVLPALQREDRILERRPGQWVTPESHTSLGKVAHRQDIKAQVKALRRLVDGRPCCRDEVLAWCDSFEQLFS